MHIERRESTGQRVKKEEREKRERRESVQLRGSKGSKREERVQFRESSVSTVYIKKRESLRLRVQIERRETTVQRVKTEEREKRERRESVHLRKSTDSTEREERDYSRVRVERVEKSGDYHCHFVWAIKERTSERKILPASAELILKLAFLRNSSCVRVPLCGQLRSGCLRNCGRVRR